MRYSIAFAALALASSVSAHGNIIGNEGHKGANMPAFPGQPGGPGSRRDSGNSLVVPAHGNIIGNEGAKGASMPAFPGQPGRPGSRRDSGDSLHIGEGVPSDGGRSQAGKRVVENNLRKRRFARGILGKAE